MGAWGRRTPDYRQAGGIVMKVYVIQVVSCYGPEGIETSYALTLEAAIAQVEAIAQSIKEEMEEESPEEVGTWEGDREVRTEFDPLGEWDPIVYQLRMGEDYFNIYELGPPQG